jgi:hypothetical protein
MNCIYHPQMPAAAYCGQCSRGLCPNCIYDPETDDRSVLCFDHVKASVDHDYSVAMNENTVAMAFRSVIAALAGLGFLSNAVSQGYSGQGFGIGILLAILVFIGTWGLYWGFKKWRAAGRPFFFFFFFWTCGGPIESAVRLAISLLFIELVLIIMILIGLFTGIQNYVWNRRIIKLYR